MIKKIYWKIVKYTILFNDNDKKELKDKMIQNFRIWNRGIFNIYHDKKKTYSCQKSYSRN